MLAVSDIAAARAACLELEAIAQTEHHAPIGVHGSGHLRAAASVAVRTQWFRRRKPVVTDRAGKRTYMIGRGEGPCPTMLVHGGLSQASEWSLLAGRLAGHVLIPDRPGCGLSYPIDYREADYRQAATGWLLELVDGLGTRANSHWRRWHSRVVSCGRPA